jgi:hypothetical protein
VVDHSKNGYEFGRSSSLYPGEQQKEEMIAFPFIYDISE